jgi:O-antigen ligase
MNTFFKNFNQNIEVIDKYLLIFISLIPIFLATSIFLADLFGSVTGIILIYIFFKKDNIYLGLIKKEIFLMIAFYFIILISLFLTEFFKISFLASFFYFRYFFISLSIFYLLKKYDFLMPFFLFIIFGTISFVILDAMIQYFNGANLFGYTYKGFGSADLQEIKYLTGFFNEEKKLGSYLVRFLPLILGLIYFGDKAKQLHLHKYILLISGIVIFASSERTALFLYFIILIGYILITKNKLRIILTTIFILLILFTLNPVLRNKYITSTLEQMEFIDSIHYKSDKIRFISAEHENLIYSAIINFKENFLFGSGVKTFHPQCKKLKEQITEDGIKRNMIQCSTHPHSTYFQLLSDIGIFGFLIIFYFLYYIILTFSKMLFNLNRTNKYFLSYYFINLGMLINLFPLIPSGSFFNNWICLMISYLFGFWLFLKTEIIQRKLI